MIAFMLPLAAPIVRAVRSVPLPIGSALLGGETGAVSPELRRVSSVEESALRRAAHMDQIFDKQGIVQLGIEDVVGLAAIAAQAGFDFKRGDADMRVAHEQIEAGLQAFHIS